MESLKCAICIESFLLTLEEKNEIEEDLKRQHAHLNIDLDKINSFPCGHSFHKNCLETELKFQFNKDDEQEMIPGTGKVYCPQCMKEYSVQTEEDFKTLKFCSPNYALQELMKNAREVLSENDKTKGELKELRGLRDEAKKQNEALEELQNQKNEAENFKLELEKRLEQISADKDVTTAQRGELEAKLKDITAAKDQQAIELDQKTEAFNALQAKIKKKENIVESHRLEASAIAVIDHPDPFPVLDDQHPPPIIPGGPEINRSFELRSSRSQGSLMNSIFEITKSSLTLSTSYINTTIKGMVWGTSFKGPLVLPLNLDEFKENEKIGPLMDGKVSRATIKEEEYAIKRVNLPVFKDAEEAQIYLKNALYFEQFRECLFLKTFEHQHIVSLKSILREKPDFFLLVLPLWGHDAGRVCYGSNPNAGPCHIDLKGQPSFCSKSSIDSKSNCKHQFMTLKQIQEIAITLLDALHYLHSADVVHRAIDPSAVLLKADRDISGFPPTCMGRRTYNAKLGSFSCARSIKQAKPSHFSLSEFDKLPNRNLKMGYWSPELALMEDGIARVPNFSWPKCDIWSLGCTIAALMRGGEPLFTKHRALLHLNEVLKVKEIAKSAEGCQAPDGVTFSQKTHYDMKQLLSLNRPKIEADEEALFEDCVEAVTEMLCFDPGNRPSCQRLKERVALFREVGLTNCPKEKADAVTDNNLRNFVQSQCGGTHPKTC